MTCIPCNQCKYCERDLYCRHPNTYTVIDYVTCEKVQEYQFCQTWRSRLHEKKSCGKEAKWFEQKVSEPFIPSKKSWKFWE